MKKEEIYIDLQGKSKEELAELFWVLKSNKERILNDGFYLFTRCYLNQESINTKLHFFSACWNCAWGEDGSSKTEITIQQLKEILQPMETLQEKQTRLTNELKEVNRLIEEENKPKVGDWVWNNASISAYKKTLDIPNIYETKITNQDLINKLNELIK